MVLTLMLELMVPTTLARGLLMLSLRPRLMPLFSMDMLDMLLPLTPMDMLHMLDTPMLLDMLVPMVLILMLELMVPTTLARGLLMLSLKLRLMLSMVLMDILHIQLPMLMDILLLLLPMDTLDMPDMLDSLMPSMVLMVPTLTWEKKKVLISNLHQEKIIYFP